jgi:hypothetical protein
MSTESLALFGLLGGLPVVGTMGIQTKQPVPEEISA